MYPFFYFAYDRRNDAPTYDIDHKTCHVHGDTGNDQMHKNNAGRFLCILLNPEISPEIPYHKTASVDQIDTKRRFRNIVYQYRAFHIPF